MNSAMQPPRIDRIALIAGPLAIALCMVWFSSWTGADQPTAALSMLWVLLSSMPVALAWLGAAMGLGWPLRVWLARHAAVPSTLQAALGIAFMLFLDASLGALGLLQLGGGAGAWVVIIGGLTLLLAQIGRRFQRLSDVRLKTPSWLAWLAAPSVAVLLVGACSAPGWLWASEFGGYDAMSYHLQLPKEWMARGRIEPLQHNVYSFLPSYMEAAYYHIALLRGSAIDWVYACQFLHALITIITALMLSQFTARLLGGERDGTCSTAFLLMLATPWIIIVGSLAYNEMAVLLLFTGGLAAAADQQIAPARRGLMIGLLAGAACGAKLTAVGMVAAPLVILTLTMISAKRWPVFVMMGAIGGIIALAPFLLRNQVHAGQPLFPFAAGLLGTAHWSAEQVQIWNSGHSADLPMSDRLLKLWHEFFAYGFGGNPNPGEPWKPQWSVLPILGVLALVLNLMRPSHRAWAVRLGIVLIVQVVFWLAFTHLKSRFLVPSAVPLSLAIALSLTPNPGRQRSQRLDLWLKPALAIALLAGCWLPVAVFASERNRAPAFAIDFANQFSGDALREDVRQGIGRAASPVVAINHVLSPNAKVLLIGQAAPLYFDLERIEYSTTWDRGPMSQVIREAPGDPAAWRNLLRNQGFTHVLVDEGMLRRWERSGWNDPLLSADRIDDFLNEFAALEHAYPNSVALYKLN